MFEVSIDDFQSGRHPLHLHRLRSSKVGYNSYELWYGSLQISPWSSIAYNRSRRSLWAMKKCPKPRITVCSGVLRAALCLCISVFSTSILHRYKKTNSWACRYTTMARCSLNALSAFGKICRWSLSPCQIFSFSSFITYNPSFRTWSKENEKVKLTLPLFLADYVHLPYADLTIKV